MHYIITLLSSPTVVHVSIADVVVVVVTVVFRGSQDARIYCVHGGGI